MPRTDKTLVVWVFRGLAQSDVAATAGGNDHMAVKSWQIGIFSIT